MSEDLQRSLQPVRAEIDEIDARLVELLNRRARCAQQVGEIKAQHGEAGIIYRPEREAQVLRRLLPSGSEPVWRDPTGDARLLQVHVHNGWVGRKIRDLSHEADAPIPFVLRVGRGLVPDRETIYQDGDLIYVACMTDRTDEIETLFASPPEKH